MSESDVLNAAADVLQRKVQTLCGGALGKKVTEDIARAMLTAGMMTKIIEALRELAEAFETSEADEP